ncbi:MAG: FAD-dependent oxidoreductase [Phycisphaerae bacterium]|nr:FAD-dependent oxidoreductase [Phycisphaerae bacterium]
MRIAIVGSGVSGLVAAYRLRAAHDVVVFEAAPRAGGHAHTVRVEHEGRVVDVDTGFIVFNRENYPRFSGLLDELGVASHPAPMSFSVRNERTGLEYAGGSFAALFAQRRNLFRPSFHAMIRGVLRFNREAPADAERLPPEMTIGQYLGTRAYPSRFAEDFLLPMGGAIWSASAARAAEIPLRFFVRFFDQHGMLRVRGQPQWYTITGGSRRYVEAIVARLGGRVQLGRAVRQIVRDDRGVTVWHGPAAGATVERFDWVVLACHSDQALALLADPSPYERDVLSAIRYRANDCALHWDRTLLPRRARAWAAWNYRVPRGDAAAVTVTYNLSILQSLGTREPLCVSVNLTDRIDPGKVYARMTYHHPVYDQRAIAAQRRWEEISGWNRTCYCGAYWRHGFHEDGVWSAHRVTERFMT